MRVDKKMNGLLYNAIYDSKVYKPLVQNFGMLVINIESYIPTIPFINEAILLYNESVKIGTHINNRYIVYISGNQRPRDLLTPASFH